MKVINQKDEQVEEEKKDLAAFMSISLSSPDESISPSTSKKTETIQSKFYSKYSIQKKKEIKKKRNFFGTKLAIKRKSRRLFVSKSASSEKRHLNVNSDSKEKEASNKRESNQTKENSNKVVNKKFKVNNFI